MCLHSPMHAIGLIVLTESDACNMYYFRELATHTVRFTTTIRRELQFICCRFLSNSVVINHVSILFSSEIFGKSNFMLKSNFFWQSSNRFLVISGLQKILILKLKTLISTVSIESLKWSAMSLSTKCFPKLNFSFRLQHIATPRRNS